MKKTVYRKAHERSTNKGLVPVKASTIQIEVPDVDKPNIKLNLGGFPAKDDGPMPVFRLNSADGFKKEKGMMLSKRVINKRVKMAVDMVAEEFDLGNIKTKVFYNEEEYWEAIISERVKAGVTGAGIDRGMPEACVRQGQIWISPRMAMRLSDGDIGDLRIVAHEATHLADANQDDLQWGPNLTFTEGAVEILSVGVWLDKAPELATQGDKLSYRTEHNGETYYETDPMRCMLRRINYPDRIAEVITNGIIRYGFDREAVHSFIEETFRTDAQRNKFFNLHEAEPALELPDEYPIVRFRPSDKERWEWFEEEAAYEGVDMNAFPNATDEYSFPEDKDYYESSRRAASLLAWLYDV